MTKEVAEGGLLGGAKHPGREVAQPSLNNIVRGKIATVLLDDGQGKRGIVGVVVRGRASAELFGKAVEFEVRIVKKRIVIGVFHLTAQIAGDRVVSVRLGDLADVLARAVLDRLAEQASRDTANPGAVNAISQGLFVIGLSLAARRGTGVDFVERVGFHIFGVLGQRKGLQLVHHGHDLVVFLLGNGLDNSDRGRLLFQGRHVATLVAALAQLGFDRAVIAVPHMMLKHDDLLVFPHRVKNKNTY